MNKLLRLISSGVTDKYQFTIIDTYQLLKLVHFLVQF